MNHLLTSKRLLLVFMLFSSVSACAKAPDSNTPSKVAVQQTNVDADISETIKEGYIVLQIGERKLHLEYADSLEERALGLMYRRSLCEDCGMLFKFDSSRIGSIWMKNTFIPLDLAYISAEGKIVDIVQLQPHDLTPVRSSMLVLYALEMNKGWFAQQDIRVGDTVLLLP